MRADLIFLVQALVILVLPVAARHVLRLRPLMPLVVVQVLNARISLAGRYGACLLQAAVLQQRIDELHGSWPRVSYLELLARGRCDLPSQCWILQNF